MVASLKDYLTMELLEGHLHVHLDLGTGPVNVRASRLPLSDGQWHHVELNLKRSMGRIAIDGATQSFETPGKSPLHSSRADHLTFYRVACF